MQVDSQVSRDPSRLTHPTKGWEERMKNIGPSGGGPVLHTFHRSTLFLNTTDFKSIKYVFNLIVAIM